jgi:hypothetical protein
MYALRPQLTGNTKERCLVSCIATERLADLTRQACLASIRRYRCEGERI